MEEQRGEQRAVLGGADGRGMPVRDELEGAENAELDGGLGRDRTDPKPPRAARPLGGLAVSRR
jgi:hypothetical protein